MYILEKGWEQCAAFAKIVNGQKPSRVVRLSLLENISCLLIKGATLKKYEHLRVGPPLKKKIIRGGRPELSYRVLQISQENKRTGTPTFWKQSHNFVKKETQVHMFSSENMRDF